MIANEDIQDNIYAQLGATESIEEGSYTDQYFNITRQTLLDDEYHPNVVFQIFQKQDAVVGGVTEVMALFDKLSLLDKVKIKSLEDGMVARPYETVMHIEGDYTLFAHLETIILGLLARATRIATNVSEVVKAANGKPVYFFPARFDHYLVQPSDGLAALQNGAAGVSTDAQGIYAEVEGMGTIPHALIAAYGGYTVKAVGKYLESNPGSKPFPLVDFNNNCIKTAIQVLSVYGKQIGGVRIDTSGNMIDRCLQDEVNAQIEEFKRQRMEPYQYEGWLSLYKGVNPTLVRRVREALDAEGFDFCEIMVSGGFDANKIRVFESQGVPVDRYGVGENLLKGSFAYTGDIVVTEGRFSGKVGREYKDNGRMRLLNG